MIYSINYQVLNLDKEGLMVVSLHFKRYSIQESVILEPLPGIGGCVGEKHDVSSPLLELVF